MPWQVRIIFNHLLIPFFSSNIINIHDLVLAGNDINEITSIESFLHKSFKIKDLGHLKYFLSLEISRSRDGIHLCQCKYALDLLFVTCLLSTKPLSSPMHHNTRLQHDSGELLPDPTPYRQLIGQLIYLINTQPDLSYYVQFLNQFMSKPTNIHFEAALRGIWYIKSVIALGIFYPASSPLQIKALCDLDWATCPDTKCLTSD